MACDGDVANWHCLFEPPLPFHLLSLESFSLLTAPLLNPITITTHPLKLVAIMILISGLLVINRTLYFCVHCTSPIYFLCISKSKVFIVWGLHSSWELVLKVLHIARCDFMTYCSRLQIGKRMWDLGRLTFIFIINFELKLFIWRWTFCFASSLESLFIIFLPFCFLVSLPSFAM